MSAANRERQPAALAANEMWSMDFVSDALFDGRRLRALTVVDAFTREALAIDVDRGDLSDAEWELIGPLLPSERGRWARPAGDNRRFLNGMLHVLRVGCPWRDMHERYGKWNSVYVWFRRWAEQGVWDALLQTLVDLGLTDDWQHMIDSTIVRGHVLAAGGKGGLLRRLLVDHAAALRARSTPAATIKASLSASS